MLTLSSLLLNVASGLKILHRQGENTKKYWLVLIPADRTDPLVVQKSPPLHLYLDISFLFKGRLELEVFLMQHKRKTHHSFTYHKLICLSAWQHFRKHKN